MELHFPYGKETLSIDIIDIEDKNLQGVLVSSLHDYKSVKSPSLLVEEALMNPIGSERLSKLAEGKRKVVLICSDHTRPVPSKVIVPPMLREIRKGNPDAEVTIVISTGCHRPTTREELIAKFGEEIVEKENIVIHKADESPVTFLGVLPSGGELLINTIVAEADLVCAEGFIEPHFFAGFSGSRKSNP